MKKELLLLLLVSTAIHLGAQTTILTQDFSTATVPALPSGWTSTVTSGGFAPLGWTTVDTPDAVYDHYVPLTGHGTYAMVYDWYWPYNTPATLTSPAFSLSAATHPYLNYDVYYLAGITGYATTSKEQAWINISTNGGTSWTTIDTIRRTGFAWATKYLSLSAYAGLPDLKLQFVYTDDSSHGFGIALDNITLFDAVANDLALTHVTPVDGDPATDYIPVGGNATFSGTVFNHGIANVTSFTVTYKVGAGAPVTTTVTGTNIPPFTSYDFTSTTPYAIPAATNYPVAIWAKLPGDINTANDSTTTHIYGYVHKPRKRVLVEEGTGTWCCWCVRGIVWMDSLKKIYDTSVSIVAVHCQDDSMRYENAATNDYNIFLGKAIINTYPSIFVDRYTTSDASLAFNSYATVSSNFALADMAITGATISGSYASIAVQVTPATDLSGDYRLALVVTEDKVHNNKYNQENCYSYQSNNEYMAGSGYNFQDSLATIPGSSMYYQYVARTTDPSMASSPNGIAGSLPANMNAGTPYSYTFNGIGLSSDWVTKNLHIVVLLINNANGYVYNTARTSWALGVTNPEAGLKDINIFPNPASNEATLTYNIEGSHTVQVKVYDVLGRLVYTNQPLQMNSGEHKMNIATADMSPGVYNVTISTETGMLTQKLTIQK